MRMMMIHVSPFSARALEISSHHLPFGDADGAAIQETTYETFCGRQSSR